MRFLRKTMPIMFIAVALFTFILLPTDVAFAVLPDSYNVAVSDKDLDWQLDREHLDIESLKKMTDSWTQSSEYDFEYLKSDPIVVAVIDTGINLDHILFTGKYDENGKEIVGEVDSNGVGQYDVLLRDSDGLPVCYNTVPASQHYYPKGDMTDDIENRHGTHVAGIVATFIHALDLEDYIKIMPIKGAYKGDFRSQAVEDAIDLALDHGASVINMSLASTSSGFGGFEDPNSVSYDAHEKAILVAAAGNEGHESGKRPNIFGVTVDYTRYPAGNKNVIGVMNHTRENKLYESKNGGSNYGKDYDLCAAGSDIYSADGNGTDIYKSLYGTSMASPVVAFGSALLTMKFRAMKDVVKRNISVSELTAMVRNTAYSTLKKGGVDYPIFDIGTLVGFDWVNAEIVLEKPAFSTQYLGEVRKVKLKFELSSQNVNGKVEWFSGENKLGEGSELEFMPENKVGTTHIVAVWTNDDSENLVLRQIERSVELAVSYMPYNDVTIRKVKTAVYEKESLSGVENTSDLAIGTEYVLRLENCENFVPVDSDRIMWYVNGVYASGGKEFVFTPDSVGKFEIKAKVKGVFTTPVMLAVAGDELPDKTFRKELVIYTFTACVVIVAVVGAVTAVVIAKHKKLKK